MSVDVLVEDRAVFLLLRHAGYTPIRICVMDLSVSENHVVASAAINPVLSGPSRQNVVAVITVQPVIAVLPAEQIIPLS